MQSLAKQLAEIRASKGREWRQCPTDKVTCKEVTRSSHLVQLPPTIRVTRQCFTHDEYLLVYLIEFMDDIDTIISLAKTCVVHYRIVFSNDSIFKGRSVQCCIPMNFSSSDIIRQLEIYSYIDTRLPGVLNSLVVSGTIENNYSSFTVSNLIKYLDIHCSTCNSIVLKNIQYSSAELQLLVYRFPRLKCIELDRCIIYNTFGAKSIPELPLESLTISTPELCNKWSHLMNINITGLSNLSVSCKLDRYFIDSLLEKNVTTLKRLKVSDYVETRLLSGFDLSGLESLAITGSITTMNIQDINVLVSKAKNITELELGNYLCKKLIGSSKVQHLTIDIQNNAIRMYDLLQSLKQKFPNVKHLSLGAGIIQCMAANMQNSTPCRNLSKIFSISEDPLQLDSITVNIADLTLAHQKALELELAFYCKWDKVEWKKESSLNCLKLDLSYCNMFKSIGSRSTLSKLESDKLYCKEYILCAVTDVPNDHTLDRMKQLYDVLNVRSQNIHLMEETELIASSTLEMYQAIYGEYSQEYIGVLTPLNQLKREKDSFENIVAYNQSIPKIKFQMDEITASLQEKVSNTLTEHGIYILNENKFFDKRQWDAPDAIELNSGSGDTSEDWEFYFEYEDEDEEDSEYEYEDEEVNSEEEIVEDGGIRVADDVCE
jgi:hypothetical protein